jgi:hypothetical protein
MQLKNKKRILSLITAVGLLLISGMPSTRAGGGGGIIGLSLTPSASSTQVGNSITLSLHTYYYHCSSDSNPDPNYGYTIAEPPCPAGYSNPVKQDHANVPATISISGSGNTLSASSVTTDASGNAHVTLSSSVAESKTVKVLDPQSNDAVKATVAVTFTAAPSATPKSVSTTTPKPTPAASALAVPAAPTAAIKVGSLTVKPDEIPTIKSGQPVSLSGETVANGVITVYVFSEPKKYTVTADKDGNWSYIVSGLEPGEHHVEAEVTDPATGKTSLRAQVLAFKIIKTVSPTVAAAQKTNVNSHNKLAVASEALGAACALVGLVLAYLWKFRRNTFDSLFHRGQDRGNNVPPVNLS